MNQFNKQTNTPPLSQDSQEGYHKKNTHQALAGLIIILALGLAVFWIYNGLQSGTLSLDGKLPRGGKYIDLAKDHPQGEKFLDYINKAYDRLENEDPDDDASAYVDIGFYKNELGDHDGAIIAYKKGLALRPDSELMLSNLAHLYENIKRYQDAEKYYQRLIEVNPRNTRGITDLASMWRYYFKDKKDAILNLVEVKGLAGNANDPNLMIFLANYYRNDLKDLERAELYYRRILELDPTNQAVRVELLNLLQGQGRTL
jgi:tetratricopeptide (TPR) repeat protein